MSSQAAAIKLLHIAAERLCECEQDETGHIFHEILGLLTAGGPDIRVEVWALGILPLYLDCLILPIPEEQLHVFVSSLPLLVDFAQAPLPNTSLDDLEVSSGR